MRGRFVEKTESEKQAWSDRVKAMLQWPECEGCKKRKEFIVKKFKEITKWH